MIPVKMDYDKCEDCTVKACVKDCPADCLALNEKDLPYMSYPEECHFCGNCRISCPFGSVSIELPISMVA